MSATVSYAPFRPVAAATGSVVNLAMQRLWLTGRILPAGARLVVQHVFRSEEDKPLEVIYSFPLPRDAALRRFRITGDGFEAQSELREREEAVKAYEQGIAAGALSTMARAYGDGLVNLTVGDIRPRETVTVHLEILCGVELRDDGFRFRFPFTLAPAYHTRARAAVLANGEGEMELPADEFGDVIFPRFREDASALHEVGFEVSIVGQLALEEVGSPSHAVRVRQDGGASARVALAAEKDVPNRDLVLDARFRSIEPQVLAGRDKKGTGRFAAIVPSASFGSSPETPRRVVILLDRSGSMQGAPLAQARNAIKACLAALSDTDSFGLVVFDNVAAAFETAQVPGTREWRDKAHEFLNQVEARGGTNLTGGLREAASMLGTEGGDILILTDGQVSGTEQILADARQAGIRLHCLGIGSASQDRFLALLARETGGVSRFVTPRERVDLPAVDLFASIGRPVASGLKAGGKIQPEPPGLVFAGTPVLLFGEVEGERGQIELTWGAGALSLPVPVGPDDIGQTVWLLQGSRLITDWESRYPSTEALAPLEKRQESRVAARLRELSRTYGLASREMSLVAVVTRQGDLSGALPETRVVPVGMPQDTPFGAYFGRKGMVLGQMARPAATPLFSRVMSLGLCPEDEGIRPTEAAPGPRPRVWFRRGKPGDSTPPLTPASGGTDDILLALAARLDADGGMPGKDRESRVAASAVALLAFLSHGHSLTRGAFRSHVARLVSFLRRMTELSALQRRVVAAVIELAQKSTTPAGDWIKLSQADGDHWDELAVAVPTTKESK